MNVRGNVGGGNVRVDDKALRHVDLHDEEEEEEGEEEEFAIIPPNGGWGWVVVFCAFYCNVIADGIQLTFGIFMKEIANCFEVEVSKVSLVGSLMFGVHLLIGPLCSGLGTMYGIRPVTAAGSLLTATGLSLCYFSPNYQFLYFSFGILGGAGIGLVYMNTLVITSLYFTSLRVLAVAIVVCGTGLGTVVFALLGNELLKITDWRTTFLIEAALAGSMFPAALTFRPLKPKRIFFTTDKALLTAKPSLISRISRKSRVSKVSMFSVYSEYDRAGSFTSMKSRRATIYIKRNIPTPGASTVHNVAMDKIAHRAILEQLSAQLVPVRCCRCNRCRKDEIVFAHPQERLENEYNYAQIDSERASTSSTIPPTPEFSKHVVETGRKRIWCDCKRLKTSILATFDFKLLRSYAFVLFCFSGAFSMSSLLIILLYEKDRSIIEHGFSEDMAVYLLMAIGAANTFWRLGLGLISIRFHLNAGVFSIVLNFLGAAASVATTLWGNLYFQFVSNAFQALGMAGFAVFRPVLLIELVGPDLVLNATGISLLFMGIFSIAAPPLVGLLMELTNNYNSIYIASGVVLVLSGLFLINIKKIRLKDLERLENRKTKTKKKKSKK